MLCCIWRRRFAKLTYCRRAFGQCCCCKTYDEVWSWSCRRSNEELLHFLTVDEIVLKSNRNTHNNIFLISSFRPRPSSKHKHPRTTDQLQPLLLRAHVPVSQPSCPPVLPGLCCAALASGKDLLAACKHAMHRLWWLWRPLAFSTTAFQRRVCCFLLPPSLCLPCHPPQLTQNMASSTVAAWKECLQQLEQNNALPLGHARLEGAAQRVDALGLHKQQGPLPPTTWRKVVVDLQVIGGRRSWDDGVRWCHLAAAMTLCSGNDSESVLCVWAASFLHPADAAADQCSVC